MARPQAQPPGLFITLEGVDGVGKTTQLERLVADLRGRGREVLVTEEPRGTALGQAIDGWLRGRAGEAPTARAETLLFLAARAQHVETVVEPALAAGRVVVCSRFSHSTLAYQGFGLGVDLPAIRAADEFARAGRQPDLVLLFQPSESAVAARLAERGGDGDRIESRATEFWRRVRDGFATLAAEQPERVAVIASDGGRDEVAALVRAAVERRL